MDELIAYYTNLLILQFRLKTKAKATVELFVREALIDLIVEKVRDGFNIETAVGEQLDIIAKYVGAKRQFVGISFDREYFNYATYSANSYLLHGYNTYTELNPKLFPYLTYEGVNTSFELSDFQLKNLIKYLILKNNSNGSTESIVNMLYTLMGNDVKVVDNQNMTLTYYFNSQNSFGQFIYNLGIYPKPIGVNVNIVFSGSGSIGSLIS